MYKEAGVFHERPLNRAIQVIILLVFGKQTYALFILIYLEETKTGGWCVCVRGITVLACICYGAVKHILGGGCLKKKKQMCINKCASPLQCHHSLLYFFPHLTSMYEHDGGVSSCVWESKREIHINGRDAQLRNMKCGGVWWRLLLLGWPT